MTVGQKPEGIDNFTTETGYPAVPHYTSRRERQQGKRASDTGMIPVVTPPTTTGSIPAIKTPTGSIPAIDYSAAIPKYSRRQDRPPTAEIPLLSPATVSIPHSQSSTKTAVSAVSETADTPSGKTNAVPTDQTSETVTQPPRTEPQKTITDRHGIPDFESCFQAEPTADTARRTKKLWKPIGAAGREGSEESDTDQGNIGNSKVTPPGSVSSGKETPTIRLDSMPPREAADKGQKTAPRYSARVPHRKTLSPWRKGLWVGVILLVLMLIAALIMGGIYAYRQLAAGQTKITTQVDVSGEFGTRPIANFSGTIPVTLTKTKTLIDGKGERIAPGGDVFLRISVWDGKTGEFQCRNGEPRQIIGKADQKTLDPELVKLVVGKTEGSRLLVRRAVTGSDGNTHAQVNVIDIMPTRFGAEKAEFKLHDFKFRDDKGIPAYISKTGKIGPTPLAEEIVRGHGEQVKDQNLVVQYGVWTVPDGKENKSTWGKEGPQVMRLSDVNQSLKDQLVDIRVGSRIAMFLPAAQAAGSDEVIILDILGVAK